MDDGNGTMFYYWTESPDVNTPYDFSQPVSGPLHLYAKWGQPQYVTSFAVDASGSTLHVVDWVKKEINVGADPVTLDATFVTVPDDYTFAFAAACADTDLISENNSITELYYNYNINEPAVYVRYANGTAAPLGSNSVFFVYYQNKTLDIRYMSMDSAGVLSDVTITNTSAAHSLTLTGSHDVSDTVTAPLAWADNASLNYYSFAIGASTPSNVTGVFNASDLRVITGAVDSDGSRPSLQVRNTWRGLQVSTDGTEWVDCGYDMALYVVYYEQQPTVILVEAQTIGTESVMGGKFKYTFTVYASADQMQGEPLFAGDYYLSSGEEQSAILFYNGAAAQVI
ncbi:MAG: hypothetical protein IKQ18_03750, partial [Clostridia bacterium]|nr:hypothetical protein [Clostridia bacterium]